MSTTAAHPDSTPRRPPPATILLVAAAVALVLTLFAWPASRLEPRDLPIAVAGPPAVANPIEQRLLAQDGAFDVERYTDEAAAREAIDDREVYGAFVATADGAKLLTASAASQRVAQMLTQAASEGQQTPVHVEDVVPAPPASSGLSSAVFPLILAGSLTAAASGLLASGALRRTGFVVAGSLLGGLAATPIVDNWLGVVEGDWAANAGVLSFTILAIAAFVAGMEALFGKVGTVVGALTMILIGNPFSAVGSAPELLPQPVGEIGQLMPPGAGGNLLRSTGFFDGAAAGGHLVVLGAWTLVGLTLLLAAGLRSRRAIPAPVPQPA
jgi:hypothetical protein